jgi:hypothetical protein
MEDDRRENGQGDETEEEPSPSEVKEREFTDDQNCQGSRWETGSSLEA